MSFIIFSRRNGAFVSTSLGVVSRITVDVAIITASVIILTKKSNASTASKTQHHDFSSARRIFSLPIWQPDFFVMLQDALCRFCLHVHFLQPRLHIVHVTQESAWPGQCDGTSTAFLMINPNASKSHLGNSSFSVYRTPPTAFSLTNTSSSVALYRY